ncbi:MAG: hypothetical protein AAF327_24680 [Cyanobacteria bacterium P01_A01_bin.37]
MIKLLIFLLCITVTSSCAPREDRIFARFLGDPDGEKAVVSLPRRNAGWFLSMRRLSYGTHKEKLSVLLKNKNEEVLYVRSSLGKKHLSQNDQMTIFYGSIEELEEKMSVYVASDRGSLDFIVSISYEKKPDLKIGYELNAYTSDGP